MTGLTACAAVVFLLTPRFVGATVAPAKGATAKSFVTPCEPDDSAEDVLVGPAWDVGHDVRLPFPRRIDADRRQSSDHWLAFDPLPPGHRKIPNVSEDAPDPH